jgi:hypothetical protein
VPLDGFVAGPNQRLQEPLSTGGEGLHEWVVALDPFVGYLDRQSEELVFIRR